MHVDLGWRTGAERMVIMDRWNPMRVHITGGASAFEGSIVAEVGASNAKSMRVRKDFVATPGLTTTEDLAIVVPALESWRAGNDLWIKLSLTDRRGRRIQSLDFSTRGLRHALRMPAPLPPTMRVIVSAGDASVLAAGADWADPSQPTSARAASRGGAFDPWAEVVVADAGVEGLPSRVAGYDSASVVVLEGAAIDRLDNLQAASLRDWLFSGGRLVLVPGRPGRDLHRLGLAGLITMTHEAPPTASLMALGGYQRLALTDVARRIGWTTRPLSLGSADDAISVAPDILAEGPAGLGWAVVVGTDPHRLGTEVRPSAAWQDILRGPLADHLHRKEIDPNWDASWQVATGYVRLNPLLNALAVRLTNSRSFPFLNFLFMIVLLAVLLGPGDRWMLRRFGRLHCSWLTALTWIAVFSVAGYFGPRMIRGKGTQMMRVVVDDIVLTPSGTAVFAAPSRDGPEALSFRSGVLAIFSGYSGARAVEGISEISRWRPIEASNWWGGRSLDFLAVTLASGALPDPLPLRVWTFRTISDEGDGPLNLRTEVTREGSGAIVKVRGLPPGAVVSSAAMYTSDGWRILTMEPHESDIHQTDSSGTLLFKALEVSPAAPDHWEKPLPREYWSQPMHASPSFDPADALQLPGALRRSGPIRLAVQSGHWACVCLRIDGESADVAVPSAAAQPMTRIVRMLVPLEERWPTSDVPPAQPDVKSRTSPPRYLGPGASER